jgi:hypothetical protein
MCIFSIRIYMDQKTVGTILISTMIAIGIATTITNNRINIALAQPGSNIPAEEGRPSPPAHPSPSTGHSSYPSSSPTSYNPSTGHSTSSLSPPSSSSPQLAAKQPTKVNPMPAENITHHHHYRHHHHHHHHHHN